mgnify:FL=1
MNLKIVNSDEFQAFKEEFRNEKGYQKSWGFKNKDRLRNHQRNYEKSEKGIESRRKVNRTRKQRMIEAQADLDYDQKMLIRDFYYSCPDGYEVDHIVPIAKGGKHCLSNLQYLTPEENRRKASRMYYKYK